jgi:methylenetetrahydrofolate--tRNA-(uracil-5-)-methyltransferase
MEKEIIIIGGGLAGCEAALCLAEAGWKVVLYEMRPGVNTPAHETEYLAELVCSNSLKSKRLDTASGLLKAEINALGGHLLHLAEACAVPAGHALAVDRLLFSQKVEAEIAGHANIKVIREEIKELPAAMAILATGPLTSDAMMGALSRAIGEEHLYFFDAIAPIIDSATIDYSKVYHKDRYDKGDADYLNCQFTKEEYYRFVDALLAGEKHEAHEFENEFFAGVKFNYYENCMPIEELARRGKDTLRHGVMKPMGLENPEGRKPFAVLQLRAENAGRTSYNLVGCQTMLRYGAQKEIFRLIPGLEQAEFSRFGSIHRNAFLNSPVLLNEDFSFVKLPQLYLAGQLAGVEGYVECIASGLLVAKTITEGLKMLPEETIIGQLWRHLCFPKEGKFQPMNANFGILPRLENEPRDKKEKKQRYSQRSMDVLQALGYQYHNEEHI